MLSANYQKSLKNNNLFIDFSLSDLTHIMANIRTCSLFKGESLFQKDQIAKHFFLVLKGEIKLSLFSSGGDETIVDFITVGKTFAEAIMFLDEKKYPINATALTDSLLLQIDMKSYLNILKRSSKTSFKIMARLSQRLHWSLVEIDNLSLHNGTYRLIYFLLTSTEKSANTQPTIDLTISKNMLAQRVSIKPETLSRILQRLSNNGLLSVNHNTITLLKPDELQNIIST